MKSFFYNLVTSLSLLSWASFRIFAADGGSLSLKDMAGDYYFGDGTGVNCSLTLSRGGNFTFQWQGCFGTYEKNNGSANIKDGGPPHHPEKAQYTEGFPRHSNRVLSSALG